ncbi:MAG: nickel-dependent lactate racemase [Methanotrichaceae archaeon]
MKLGYGRGYLELETLGEVVLPGELPAAGDCEIERALDEPIGRHLTNLSGNSAVILASDITRPAPSYFMIPPLQRMLKHMGISEIKVIFALGTHRRMDPGEEKALLKDCIGLPHMQHDPERCVSVGKTSRGTPVEILEDVASSDLVIATGNIEYHYYAGYSGGAKAMLPGVSSGKSIVRNHELMRDPCAVSGRVDSPVRQDMEEAAAIGGLDYILNVVLNSRQEIVRAVAGDFVRAHRAGAEVVDQMYRRVIKPAEIVVACAGGMPKDINLFQAQKALDNSKNAAVPGGTIILVAECSEGLGNSVFERWANEAKCAEDCIERFGREYEFGGHKAAFLAMESLKHDLILVSSIPPEKVRKCFFTPAKTLNEAISMAQERQGKDARMIVMPHGNLTLAAAAQKQ